MGWGHLSPHPSTANALTGGVLGAGDVVVARDRLYRSVAEVALDCVCGLVWWYVGQSGQQSIQHPAQSVPQIN